MRYTDEDLLRIVGEERKRSIGFGEGDGGSLEKARELALSYYKGEMSDVPSLPNRSAVRDSTVADAIETVLPDVMEVFIGGEDVATFVPDGEDDEDAAQEETDFVHHVIFTENEGFLNLYSSIKDSLLTRTGLLHWWWEEDEKTEPVAKVDADTAQMMQAVAGVMGQELETQEPEEEGGQATLNITKLHCKVKVRAVPSEDFSIAADAVSLREATYCVMRDRPRVQDLIARGIDPEKARALKTYGSPKGEEVREMRDRADETDTPQDGASGDLRIVEVRAHFIRIASEEGGKLKVWRIITDSEEKVLLDKDEIGLIPFAAFTPYIVPHRFHGESVADKLIEVQRIKTVLLRNHLDSIYFALNQRMAVDMNQANEFTISDLLRNEPGVPIRTKGPSAVQAVAAGALNVDTLASLEFAATMAESRSGIVRNAQPQPPCPQQHHRLRPRRRRRRGDPRGERDLHLDRRDPHPHEQHLRQVGRRCSPGGQGFDPDGRHVRDRRSGANPLRLHRRWLELTGRVPARPLRHPQARQHHRPRRHRLHQPRDLGLTTHGAELAIDLGDETITGSTTQGLI